MTIVQKQTIAILQEALRKLEALGAEDYSNPDNLVCHGARGIIHTVVGAAMMGTHDIAELFRLTSAWADHQRTRLTPTAQQLRDML